MRKVLVPKFFDQQGDAVFEIEFGFPDPTGPAQGFLPSTIVGDGALPTADFRAWSGANEQTITSAVLTNNTILTITLSADITADTDLIIPAFYDAFRAEDGSICSGGAVTVSQGPPP